MGTVPNAVFERMMEAVDGNRSAEVMTAANQLLDAGNSPAQLARQCVRYLRNTLIAKIAGLSAEGETADGVGNELLQISPDEQRRAARTAALFSEEELTRFLQVMLRTFDELGYRQEQRFHFELGLLKLVHLRRLLPIEEALSQLRCRNGCSPLHAATPASPARPESLPACSPPPRPACLFALRAGQNPPPARSDRQYADQRLRRGHRTPCPRSAGQLPRLAPPRTRSPAASSYAGTAPGTAKQPAGSARLPARAAEAGAPDPAASRRRSPRRRKALLRRRRDGRRGSGPSPTAKPAYRPSSPTPCSRW